MDLWQVGIMASQFFRLVAASGAVEPRVVFFTTSLWVFWRCLITENTCSPLWADLVDGRPPPRGDDAGFGCSVRLVGGILKPSGLWVLSRVEPPALAVGMCCIVTLLWDAFSPVMLPPDESDATFLPRCVKGNRKFLIFWTFRSWPKPVPPSSSFASCKGSWLAWRWTSIRFMISICWILVASCISSIRPISCTWSMSLLVICVISCGECGWI